MKTGCCLFFTLLLSTLQSLSQDKLILMNGKIIEGKVLSVSDSIIQYSIGNRGKIKTRQLDHYRVFSIERANGEEEILYTEDAENYRLYTVDEMRSFIYGEQDAWAGYRPYWVAFVTGTLSAVGSAAIHDYKTERASVWVIGMPLLTYFMAMAIIPAGVNKKSVRDEKYLDDPSYMDGYKRVSRAKKNRYAMYGSAIGAAVGLGAFGLIVATDGD